MSLPPKLLIHFLVYKNPDRKVQQCQVKRGRSTQNLGKVRPIHLPGNACLGKIFKKVHNLNVLLAFKNSV